MLDSVLILVQIDCPLERAYAYASDPKTWPAWAGGVGRAFRQASDQAWIADTPGGEARIEFTAPNALGVLDHVVHTPDGQVVRVPMRMVENWGGTDVLFTLFRQPGMTDEQLAADAALVRRDLEALKTLLEGSA